MNRETRTSPSASGSLGRFGETYAAHFLQRRGYVILGRNLNYKSGEIDILAQQGEELVFVEVKTRRSTIHALPEDSITDERLEHLEGAIAAYLDGRDLAWRIEVVCIEVDRSGRVTRCEVLQDVGLR